MKTALITGVTGQDGSYLAELLLAKGYTVYGLIRPASVFNTQRVDHIYQDPHDEDYRFRLVYGDVTDVSVLNRIIRTVKPDEVYNLAAQSHVGISFKVPDVTTEITAMGAVRLLEAIRDSGIETRYYQASSSELFGSSPPPQNEDTPFRPRSPYAAAKLYAYWITVNYREAYGIHASNGILFNHESERRGERFVTRKISRAVGRIKAGLQDKLHLGNLDAKRDWGYAPDYVEAMWAMLQVEEPGDYVISTGESHTVREFCDIAFSRVSLDYRNFVEVDPRYFRPTEVNHLEGDCTKANEVLGWTPKTTFAGLVERMVDSDLELAMKDRAMRDSNH